MTKKFISFRELFNDPNEPEDRGISLENPRFEEDIYGIGLPTVEFAVIDKPKEEEKK